MMKKFSIYFSLLLMASCAAEEAAELNSPTEFNSPRIVVCGGSTAPGATRAEEWIPDEPSNLGVCNADTIKILTFKKAKTGNVSASDMKLEDTQDISLSNKLTYRDKWTSYLMGIPLSQTIGNWFAFPSIAYNPGDGTKFSISSDSYQNLKLNIPLPASDTNFLSIPELYFGRLLPSSSDYQSKYSTSDHKAEAMVYNYSTPEVTDNQYLEGKLYRIVSQLNVNISEVNSNVERIEMYLSNVPTQIGLYAKHRTALSSSGTDRGFYYPIVEASTVAQHLTTESGILICSVTDKDYSDGTANLSTFILPSAKGRTVTIKAYFKTPIDEEGNKSVTRTLQASQNYYLDEKTSEVYFSKTPLIVYNAAENTFMSYPNVRVNVSGKLSDIFSEESESNVVIEICPNYDGQHEIRI